MVILNSFCAYSSVFKGEVYDTYTKEPLIGANIYLSNLEVGAASDQAGAFQIDNIPNGNHIVRVNYLGYSTIIDSIIIDTDSTIIERDYALGYKIFLDSDREIESYHSKLYETNKPDSILSIHLDSLAFDGRYLYYCISVTNLADTLLYLPPIKECWSRFKPLIINSGAVEIRNNLVDLGCDDGINFYPNKNDIIAIRQSETYTYPAIKIRLHDFSTLPKDEYTVRIIYKNEKPEFIHAFWVGRANPREINDILCKYVRGEYVSKNQLSITNY